jgi:hypothetical protein
VKEAVEKEEIKIIEVRTHVQYADMLAGGKQGMTFQRNRDTVMGGDEVQRYFGTMVPPAPSNSQN